MGLGHGTIAIPDPDGCSGSSLQYADLKHCSCFCPINAVQAAYYMAIIGPL